MRLVPGTLRLLPATMRRSGLAAARGRGEGVFVGDLVVVVVVVGLDGREVEEEDVEGGLDDDEVSCGGSVDEEAVEEVEADVTSPSPIRSRRTLRSKGISQLIHLKHIHTRTSLQAKRTIHQPLPH